MKGAILQEKGKIVIKDNIPKPKIKKDQVLIKVKNCGICGSDMESYHSGALILSGLIIGHEFSGEIVEIGESVKKWKIGDRVTANPNLNCGKCNFCLQGQENLCRKSLEGIGLAYNGAMAEFVGVRADRLHSLPQNVSFEEGALVEPLTIAVYGVQESWFKIGENAVVYGAGTIGLLTTQVLNTIGASDIYVIEPSEFNQKKALEMGASEVFMPNNWGKINKLTNKIGPDHVFDCAGVPQTYINSIKIVRKGGFITVIGLHAEPFQMEGFMQLLTKNITMRGIYGYNQDTFRTTISLLKKKKIDVKPIITKKIKVGEVPEAFKTLSNPNNEEIKILVEFD
ncbi:MAG: zinc-dependent alcohol dehydrogenase [Candidatus Helarchaeota archaeon]